MDITSGNYANPSEEMVRRLLGCQPLTAARRCVFEQKIEQLGRQRSFPRLLIGSPSSWGWRIAFSLATMLMFIAVGPHSLRAAVTEEEQQLVDQVMRRLLAVSEAPTGYDAWPPEWKVIDDEEPNAFAWLDPSAKPKKIPVIRIHKGFLKLVAEMNEHRVAYVLGHELAHLLRGHLLPSEGDNQGQITSLVFDREQEIEADQVGMALALNAGYSYKEALQGVLRMREVGSGYSSFEGNGTSHPSWSDRLALLQTDEAQQQLWQSMSAFETGVFLLQSEQYRQAEFCFERVTRDFPRCTEAWANLGYAQLMQYCDQLEPQNLEDFGIGPLILGGFYARANLEDDRAGIDESLWWKAVGSLQKALVLDEKLILAKANLAIAYLVHPSGTSDVGKAAELFAQVEELLQDAAVSQQLDPLARASLLANAWIGLHHGDAERSRVLMAELDRALEAASNDNRTNKAVAQVRAQMGYTQALQLASGTSPNERREALTLLEKFLQGTPARSSWWEIAYAKYTTLAQELSATPLPKEKFKEPTTGWRPVTGITLADGTLIGLAENTTQAIKPLGEAGAVQPILTGINFKRYSYPDQGLAVIGGRQVVAVVLNQANSPRVPLQRIGLAGATESLFVGMSRADLEKLLGDAWSSESMALVEKNTRYQFYKQVGVGVKYRDGKVVELVLTVAPL